MRLAGIEKEAFDVFLFEDFDTAFGHAFQDHLTDLYANEFFNEVSVCFEEAADFTFFAVVEVNFEAAGVAFADFGGRDDFFCFEEFAFVFDSVEEFLDVGFIEVSMENDAVFFYDLAAWVGEAVGEVAVVGEDEEAFAVFIEATGTEHALSLEVAGEEFEDGLPAVGIGVGAEEAFGFV